MSDPYTTITSQPRETLEECARILELRGKESQQVCLREKVLQDVSGRVLEVRGMLYAPCAGYSLALGRVWHWPCHQAHGSTARGGVCPGD